MRGVAIALLMLGSAPAAAEVEPICTICCRDHHVSDDRSPAFDPWRASANGDTPADHYGYASQGNGYDLDGGLLPTSKSDGLYLDACQLMRVRRG